MHIHAHVASALNNGLAGMHAHPDADLATSGPLVRREGALRHDGTRHGIGSARECDKERITLGVDFEATPFRESRPQEPPLILQDVGVRLAQLLQQPGGPLYIREQERDRARRDGLARLTRGISAVRNDQHTLQRYG